MTQYTKRYTPTIVSNQNNVASNSQDLLRDELNHLESLPEEKMCEELLDDFFGKKRILSVPMFVETLKNFLTKGSASLTRSNIKQYPHLHIVSDTKGELIAYVYNRGKEKGSIYKSPTDVFFDYFDNR